MKPASVGPKAPALRVEKLPPQQSSPLQQTLLPLLRRLFQSEDVTTQYDRGSTKAAPRERSRCLSARSGRQCRRLDAGSDCCLWDAEARCSRHRGWQAAD